MTRRFFASTRRSGRDLHVIAYASQAERRRGVMNFWQDGLEAEIVTSKEAAILFGGREALAQLGTEIHCPVAS